MGRFLFSCFLIVTFCASSFGQQSGVNDSLRLDSLTDLMYQYNDSQKFDSAILYANEVVLLTYNLYGNSREYAVSLNNLGYLYGQNFDYNNESVYIKKALAALEKYAGKNDSDYAAFTNNLAILYDNLGNYSAAEPLYKESASIRKTIFGESDIYAESLNNLGNFYRKVEIYDSAKTYLEQSLTIHKKIKGFSYIQTLNTLGLVIQKTGNYSSAESKYKEAITLIDSCCGGKGINEYWNIKNNLASLYFDMSNYKSAEIIHKQVLAHILDKFHKKIVDYATTLGLLANDYNASGEYDSALYFLKDASEILLKELSDSHPEYATNLNVIALTYQSKGKSDSAKKYFNKVLEIRKNIFGTTAPVYAETLNNLGLISIEKKEFANAEDYFKRSSKIRLAAWGEDHPAYAESKCNLLNLYYAADKPVQWARILDSTIDIWKSSTLHLLLSFGEREKQIYLDNHLSQRDLFLSMLWYFSKHQNTDSLHASYFKMVTALQGWLLSGSMELNKIVAQKEDSSLLAIFSKWVEVKNIYARTIQLNEEQQKNNHLNADSLMQVAGDLERAMIDKLPELQNSLNNTAASPEKIAAKLKKNEVLVNWVSFRYKNPDNWTDSILYAAFIISSQDKRVRFVTAFEQNQLKVLLENYFNYSGRGITMKASQTKKSIGVDLYKVIWQPLLPYIKNADKVFLIPSGLLNKVSFQSIEDVAHKTLLESVEVHLLSNANEVNDSYSLSPKNGNISLFGGADFDSTITGETLHFDKYKRWKYLEGSADEVKELNDLFEKHNWRTQLYLGVAASERDFKALSGNNSPEILHIATHGFYRPPLNIPGINAEMNKNKVEFPLLRSGFVLSGANIYRNNDTSLIDDEDGIVTAQEISNLNFNNTRLLTLSACQTALGDINNNEGVYGLQRAFKIAGVKEMLITLWQIPDKETKELMNLFYTHIFNGDSYYQALRKSQLTMKKKYPDPAVWAGFELIGE